METKLNQLQKFIDELWDSAHMGGTFDGSDVQELMLKHNLLKKCAYQEDPTDINSELLDGYNTIDLTDPDQLLTLMANHSKKGDLKCQTQKKELLQAEKNRLEGVLLGLKISKEMFARGQMSPENIYEHEIACKEQLSKLGFPSIQKKEIKNGNIHNTIGNNRRNK